MVRTTTNNDEVGFRRRQIVTTVFPLGADLAADPLNDRMAEFKNFQFSLDLRHHA